MKDKECFVPLTIGELPSSYIESMTYPEYLLAIEHYINNTMNPAINKNTEDIVTINEEIDKIIEDIDKIIEDFDNYYTKEEIDTTLENYYTKEEIDTTLDDYYTKTEVDTTLVDYVKNTDYATSSKGGVVKVNSNVGTAVTSDGKLYAQTKTYEQYTSAQGTTFIGKSTLENVITGKGLVSNTNYATTGTGGVIKANSTYNLAVSSSGNPYTNVHTYEQYLNDNNGMFIGKGTLENVITGKELVSNNYSTSEETIVGKWIDGKTIYRKVFNFTVDTATTNYTIDVNNIDTVVRLNAVPTNQTGEVHIIPHVTSNNGYNQGIMYFKDTNQIAIKNGSLVTLNYNVNAIIEYTKTS